jgi:ASTRA-associated protein 1
MAVSALNFCAFALCATSTPAGDDDVDADQAIVAVPNALDAGGIDFFNLPSERRVSVLKSDAQIKTGMVMALDIFHHPDTGSLTVISGYEDGRTMVHRRRPRTSQDDEWKWETILIGRPHSQPVLSLDTTPSKAFYFTSSADAMIAKFAIPISSLEGDVDMKAAKISNTKHAGQQDLTVRQDGKIFATAGWDGRIRAYSAKSLKELAVLKWHSGGCYSIAFAESVLHDGTGLSSESGKEEALVPSTASTGSALEAIRHQRNIKAQNTHWLAGGGKDGKISLWDIY